MPKKEKKHPDLLFPPRWFAGTFGANRLLFANVFAVMIRLLIRLPAQTYTYSVWLVIPALSRLFCYLRQNANLYEILKMARNFLRELAAVHE